MSRYSFLQNWNLCALVSFSTELFYHFIIICVVLLIFTDNHIHIPSSTVDPLSSHFILHGVSVSIPLSLCLFLKLFSCRDFFSVSALHKIHRPFVVMALLSSSVPVRHEIATVSQHEQHVSACTTTTWKYLQLKILLRFSIIFLCGFYLGHVSPAASFTIQSHHWSQHLALLRHLSSHDFLFVYYTLASSSGSAGFWLPLLRQWEEHQEPSVKASNKNIGSGCTKDILENIAEMQMTNHMFI